MFKNYFVLTFSILFISSLCYQPEDFKCDIPKMDKLKVGDEVVLCIHTINQTQFPEPNKNQKIAISIKVDEYSILSVDGIRAINRDAGDNDMELLAQINEITSVFTTVSI